ncbi:MAG: hypothetical protein HKN80_12355 [Acidimicrobiia bacterium]|nr:hypothetical protein [Acidimicrobiia bacterium]
MGHTAPRDFAPGAGLFVRYAYPPNRLGYCGPEDVDALVAYGVSEVSDPGLRRLVTAFEGAYPYLELIAASAGIRDPLDRRVVEAYWIGNRLLTGVDMAGLGRSMTERFRSRAGRHWDRVAEAVWAGGLAHHSFHVFAIYPWVGLMREGRIDEPLQVLDRCRIRWGKVQAVEGSSVSVVCRHLVWSDRALVLTQPQVEIVQASPSVTVEPGDWVSLHWEWVCDTLTPRQLANLRGFSTHHLRLVNEELAVPLEAAAG